MSDSSTDSSMDGKVVVVTGGNTGIGLEAAVALAGQGARVLLASRNTAKGTAAVEEIRSRSGSDAVEALSLDLASIPSIAAFADDVLSRADRLDVLLNNAGLVQMQRTETTDGFETTFGVNHLGHFHLTNLLLDRLRASAPARIVNVSSHAHRTARKGLDFDDLQSEQRYRSFDAYGKSKLANILFTRELTRRLEGTGVTANALHPGFVASSFGKDGDLGWIGTVGLPIARPFAISAPKGARTSVWLASSPDVATTSGGYFYKCKPSKPSKAAQDDEAARRLWAASEELVAGAR